MSTSAVVSADRAAADEPAAAMPADPTAVVGLTPEQRNEAIQKWLTAMAREYCGAASTDGVYVQLQKMSGIMGKITRNAGDYNYSISGVERSVKELLYKTSIGRAWDPLDCDVFTIKNIVKSDTERLINLGLLFEQVQAEIGACLTAINGAAARATALSNEYDAIMGDPQ